MVTLSKLFGDVFFSLLRIVWCDSFRWSASSCEQEHQYICQHRMPYVSEKNRQKIYNKWNETYPNEMANEIEVVLSEDDLLR